MSRDALRCVLTVKRRRASRRLCRCICRTWRQQSVLLLGHCQAVSHARRTALRGLATSLKYHAKWATELKLSLDHDRTVSLPTTLSDLLKVGPNFYVQLPYDQIRHSNPWEGVFMGSATPSIIMFPSSTVTMNYM